MSKKPRKLYVAKVARVRINGLSREEKVQEYKGGSQQAAGRAASAAREQRNMRMKLYKRAQDKAQALGESDLRSVGTEDGVRGRRVTTEKDRRLRSADEALASVHGRRKDRYQETREKEAREAVREAMKKKKKK